ncbi:MAG: nucleotidyltransferase domain-containing protein [Caldilineaceae bacterium]
MIQKQVVDKQKLIDIARRHRIAYLALFGSYAREEARPDSDVDLYVRFGRHIGLFEMLSVKHEIEDALGLAVDLIAEEVVEPYQFVREGMAKDLVVVYDAEREPHGATQWSSRLS